MYKFKIDTLFADVSSLNKMPHCMKLKERPFSTTGDRAEWMVKVYQIFFRSTKKFQNILSGYGLSDFFMDLFTYKIFFFQIFFQIDFLLPCWILYLLFYNACGFTSYNACGFTSLHNFDLMFIALGLDLVGSYLCCL